MTKTSQIALGVAKVVVPLAILAAGAFGMIALIAGAKKPEPRALQKSLPLVDVLEIRPAERRLVVPSRGIVKPRVNSVLTSRVRGEILEVAPVMTPGAFFKKGQLLLRVDDKDYKSALASRKADLARAQLALDIEVKEAEVSKKEWEKLMKGEPDPLVLHKPQLAEARANVAAAEAALAQAELDLARTRILAPYDGQVDARLVDLGRYLSVGTSLARIHGIDTAEIRLPLLDSELAFLDLPKDLVDTGGIFEGPVVRLHGEFLGKPREWLGRIKRMEGEIDPKTQMAYLVARIEDPYNRQHAPERSTLPMGIYLQAEIQGRQLDKAIIVPRRALQRPSEVFVLASEGGVHKLLRREVKILRKQGNDVIIGSGLHNGDRVCLTQIDSFADGMQVKLHEDPGAKR